MSKMVLITGATSGLGYEFVRLFSNDGYHLVLVSRNEDKMREMMTDFPSSVVKIIPKDLSVPGAAEEVFNEVMKEDLEIDILVNNAGFGLKGSFEKLDLPKQTEMIQLNITALTELTHYFLPKMIENDSGKILNVASTAAFQPGPNMAVYFATKAYVLSFSEGIAEELSDRNVTVTTLCPGATHTNFSSVANLQNSKMFSRAMSAKEVALEGYHSLMAGKRIVVTGSFNRVGTIAAKLLPRSTTAKIVKGITSDR